MNDVLFLLLASGAGLGLGAIFFGGLWWTVRRGLSSHGPALWFLGSLLLRTGIVLAGFYLVGRGNWPRMVVCLVGFMIARFLVMRLTRTPVENKNTKAKQPRYAP